jgi:hypothetical protein
MKRSIVPAQITTVEDKVLGNLSPIQAGLISVPLVIGVLFYVVLPKHFHFETYKLALLLGLELIGATLSIRINDQMLAFWLAMRLQYNLRPRFYIYDKNDTYLRNIPTETEATPAKAPKSQASTKQVELPKIPVSAVVRMEEIMADASVNLRFKTDKNGKGLYAIANEIK